MAKTKCSEPHRRAPAFSISEGMMESIRNSTFAPYYFSSHLADQLVQAIKEAELPTARADATFNHVRVLLEEEKDILPGVDGRCSPDGLDSYHLDIETCLEKLEYTAVSYFSEILLETLKEKDIAAISRICATQIRQLNETFDRYVRMAYIEIKKDTDVRLEEAKKEYEDRKATGYFEAIDRLDENQDDKKRATPPEEVTRKRIIMVFDDLMPDFKAAAPSKKAEFISSLFGWNAKKLGQEFSYIAGHRNSDSKFAIEDRRWVEEWKRKLGVIL